MPAVVNAPVSASNYQFWYDIYHTDVDAQRLLRFVHAHVSTPVPCHVYRSLALPIATSCYHVVRNARVPGLEDAGWQALVALQAYDADKALRAADTLERVLGTTDILPADVEAAALRLMHAARTLTPSRARDAAESLLEGYLSFADFVRLVLPWHMIEPHLVLDGN